MAVNRIFGAVSITQGTGSLTSIDSIILQDNDMSIVRGDSNQTTGGHLAEFDGIYFYRWESNRSDAHNPPFIVRPANLTSGQSGRWFLISPTHFMENLIVDPNARMIINEIFGNDAGLILGYNEDGPVTGLSVVNGGSGFTDGTFTNEPTSGGSGTGLTVDVTVVSGVVSSVIVNNGGDDYIKDDEITLDNFAGVTLSVTSVNNISIKINELDIEVHYDTRFFGFPTFETTVGGSAPFGVNGNQNLVTNLNAEFLNGEPVTNVSLLDGTGQNYSVLPQVTDATSVYPSIDAELVTKKWVDDQLAASGTIDHNDLYGLHYSDEPTNTVVADDHPQYALISGNRSGVGFTGVISGQYPTIADHLSTKQYVDDEITALSITSYLKRDGVSSGVGNNLTSPARYDAAVDFSALDVNGQYVASVGYVTQSISNHSSLGDPHPVYLRNDVDDNTAGRITSSVLNSVAPGNLTTRQEVDNLITNVYTNTSSSDGFTDINSNVVTSNIVRKDWPLANRNLFRVNNIESDDASLPTYAYIYARLANLLEYDNTVTIGVVKEITISTAGSGYTTGTGVTTTTITGSGTGLTVDIESVGGSGELQVVKINNPGTGYNNGDVVAVDGGTGGELTTNDVVLGALHGDLLGTDSDDHVQYILVDGTRAFDNTVDYPKVADALIDPSADAHLATKRYVDGVVGAAGTVSDVNDLQGSVDIYQELGAISTYPDSPSSGLASGATTAAASTYFHQIPSLDSTSFPNHDSLPQNDYTDNNYLLASKGYVDYAVGSGATLSGVVTTQGTNPLINNQIYTPKYPIDYFIDNQDSSPDEDELVNKAYVDKYAGLSLVSDTDEYMTYLFETFENTGRVSSLVGTINDGSATGIIVEYRDALKETISRVQINDGGDGFFVIDASSTSFPQTIGTGSTTNNPTFDAAGVDSTYTETNVTLAAGTTNPDVRPSVVIGDVGIVEIVSGGSGYGASTTVDIYFSGDGEDAVWEGTTDASGVIVSVQRKTVASTPYTFVSDVTIDDGGAGGTGADLNGYVVGEIVYFNKYDGGAGLANPTYTYEGQSGTVVQDEGFTWAGYGTDGTDPNSYTYVTFINANDEKVKLDHYGSGTLSTNVGASPFTVTSGNIISSLSFDEWGHITDIAETGVPGASWTKVADTDSPVSMTANTNYFADTSVGTIEMRLPATPAIGETVSIDDYQKNSSVNNITVTDDVGGSPIIEGVTDTLVIDVDGSRTILTYVDGTYGWRYKVI